MKYEIAIIKDNRKKSGWVNGTVNGYRFQAKVFNESSHYGIDNGRISKLVIWDEVDRQRQRTGDIFGATIMNYDRGWDIEPKEEDFDLVEAMIEYLEKLSLTE